MTTRLYRGLARGITTVLVLLSACSSKPASAPQGARPRAPSATLLSAPPAGLAPELSARLVLLSDLCAVALHTSDGPRAPLVAGCRSCPPFDDASARPDGKIALDSGDFFALELVVPGHFTAADADERLAVFNGCEPHSDNWGGTLVLRRDGAHFRALNYVSGLHPSECTSYPRMDGRDLAVCRYTDAHQSIATDRLFSVDFSTRPPTESSLLELSSEDLCLSTPGTRSATSEVIERFGLGVGGSKDILEVRSRLTKDVWSERYRRYCDERTQSDGRVEPPPTTSTTIERRFHFDGRAFAPD